MKKLLLIIFAVLLLCSCGMQEEPLPEEPQSEAEIPETPETEPEITETPEEEREKIPEEKPEFEFEKPEILYPENVPEELFESAAFAEAMNRPSVILYDYEPISDCAAAVNFVEAAEKEEYSELYIFRFANIDSYDFKDASCTCFFTENGEIIQKYEYWTDWETSEMSSSRYEIKKIYINDYGHLTAEYESMDPVYYKVISDFELYENAAEHLALKEKYIDPIFTITVSPQEFSSVSELSHELIWIFEDIYNYENGHSPRQEYGNDWPVPEILSLLNRYFEGVTTEMLLSNYRLDYNRETDTVYYEGGRGGVPPERRVFDYEQNGDILTLYYHLYHEESGTVYNDRYYVLEIKLLGDGSFRYLSQKIAERES